MKQVNIVGLGTSWIDAPKDGECWGMTGLIHYRPVTRLFDIHDLEWNKEQWLNHYRLWLSHAVDEAFMVNKAVLRWHSVQEELKKIKELGVPLYSVKKYPDIPSSIEYPIKEVMAHFDSDYFSSTFDYAIALALFEEYDRIDIYGAKMCAKEEYGHQRPGFSYWLGVAKGLGVACKIHGETELMTTFENMMYGYNILRMVRNE